MDRYVFSDCVKSNKLGNMEAKYHYMYDSIVRFLALHGIFFHGNEEEAFATNIVARNKLP